MGDIDCIELHILVTIGLQPSLDVDRPPVLVPPLSRTTKQELTTRLLYVAG